MSPARCVYGYKISFVRTKHAQLQPDVSFVSFSSDLFWLFSPIRQIESPSLSFTGFSNAAAGSNNVMAGSHGNGWVTGHMRYFGFWIANKKQMFSVKQLLACLTKRRCTQTQKGKNLLVRKQRKYLERWFNWSSRCSGYMIDSHDNVLLCNDAGSTPKKAWMNIYIDTKLSWCRQVFNLESEVIDGTL